MASPDPAPSSGALQPDDPAPSSGALPPDDPAPPDSTPSGAPGRLPRGRPDILLDAARQGDRRALARLLTLVETGGAGARAVAALAYRSGAEPRTVGITGAPGAGKSTLTGRLVGQARRSGLPMVAVLAVDPSSPFTGGAVLGDRIRMQDHADDEAVYIRSMATRGHLGGLSLAVPEAVRVLGAAGAPLVLVETVGVGQVEVEVASATDTTVVVVNPRWGDAVQANKAGLLEIADVFAVNKADMPGASETRRDLEQMLDLAGHDGSAESGEESGWRPPVVETVAAPGAEGGTGRGMDDLWAAIEAHRHHLESSGTLEGRRRRRLERELQRVLDARIAAEMDDLRRRHDAGVVADVLAHRIDPYEAADRLLADLGRRVVGQGDQPGGR